MKLRAVVLFAWSALASMQAYASGGPPPPFYSPPSYIDSAYSPARESELTYGQKGQFNQLLEAYIGKHPDNYAWEPNRQRTQLDYQHFKSDFDDLIAKHGIHTEIIYAMNDPGCERRYYDATLQFLEAALSDPDVTKEDFYALAATRAELLKLSCPNNGLSLQTNLPPYSLEGKPELEAYAHYLEAARNFYKGSYMEALALFTALKERPPTLKQRFYSLWRSPALTLREMANYMIARCQLMQAQEGWDGYSDPLATVDQNMVKAADVSYQNYIKTYPQGRYVRSAQNIKRRIWLLSGHYNEFDYALVTAMGETFKQSPVSEDDQEHAWTLVTEFKHYYHGKSDMQKDPAIVIAYNWLGSEPLQVEDLKILQNRKKDFTAFPGLFRYLQALGYSRLEQYQELLARTPEEPVTNNVLSLSTQLLRAHALDHLDEQDEALAALLKMHNASSEDAVELEIAELKLTQHDGIWLYSKASPLKTEKVLRSVAQFALTDDELQKSIDAKDVTDDKRQFLIDELMRRYVLSRRFKEADSLLTTQQAQSFFTSLKPAIATLAKKPNDAQALADVGEFLYKRYITPASTFDGYNANHWNYGDALSELLPRCEPCQNFKERSKNYFSPISFFRSTIDSVRQAGRKSEAEAKALHYIVRCERQSSEFEVRCKWQMTWDKQPSDDDASKTAFMRLHKLYKNSPWTTATPYYY